MNSPAQIFLCYARQDEHQVRTLYQRLSAAGFTPWMDQEDIYPGERWQESIDQAIQRSDFFLACLSTRSVNRRGFLQREIKAALDLWQEKLHSDIYLIPARLEPCEVPDALRYFQWVNLYEERGWTRLLRALQVGLERRAAAIVSRVQEPSPTIAVPIPPGPPVEAESTAPQSPREGAPTDWSAEIMRALELMRSLHLGAQKRVEMGDALAGLGDPRFRADAWYLIDEPLLGFVEIPAGPFLMGSDQGRDPEAFGDELPHQEITLPGYYIGRYLVTKEQFQAFVEARGYRPGDEDHLRGLPNHPVVNVTWYEGLQYCEWLTDCLRDWTGTPEPRPTLLRREGWQVTLPSEAEWEKAARGWDGRRYPWGNDPDPERANYDATGILTTSAVGCFPGGTSPYGLEDSIGNVWEWTRSRWGTDWGQPTFQYPYTPDDGREDRDASPDVFRVLRGGAFDSLPRFVRCAFRLRNLPNDRFKSFGFRVVARPRS